MNQNPNFAGGMLCALLCVAVVLVAVLVIYIFFCLTLQRTQTEVHPRNRQLAPGLVWLHLLHLGGSIPLIGIVIGLAASVWDIIMVVRLSGSLQEEFRDRGWRTDGESFGRVTGLIWSVGQLAGLPIGFLFGLLGPKIKEPAIAIALVVVLLGLGLTLLVCWIVYWVQMAGYGRRLRESRGRYRPGGLEADYDDDYRPPRREWDDEDEPYPGDDHDRPRRLRDDPAAAGHEPPRREEDEYGDRPPRRAHDGREDYDDRRDRPRRDEY